MEHAMVLPLAAMMEQAARDQLVLARRLKNGREVLVYPMQSGSLVGVGVVPGYVHAVDSATVLRRRGRDMARYGAWLPALFEDGSLYVLRRCIGQAGGDVDAVPADDLLAAAELLDD